jgi:outer membrane protein
VRSAIVAVVLLAAANGLAQNPPARLTLRELTDEALAASPAVAGVHARKGLAEARLREARSMWLPRVDASATLMRSDNPVFVFGSLLEQGRFDQKHFDPAFLNDPDPMSNTRVGVNVRYTLFDQFRRLNAGRQAENAVEQASLVTGEAQQRIRVEAISRFYGVLLAEQKRDVARESVRSAEADAKTMNDRLEQGLLVQSDVLAAEVQLASWQQRLIEAEGEVAIARAALATLLQRPLDQTLELDGAIPTSPFAASELADDIAKALEQRAEVQIQASSVENARLQIDTARGSLLPRADAFASWGASRGDPDRAIGVVLGIDLFDGAKYARVAESRAAHEAARAEAKTVRDRVTMEVVTAWYRARAARDRVEVAAKAAERADAASRIVRDRYENGLTTITEQLRAQTALLAARLDLLAARYDYAVGHAELLRATGGLHDVESFL